MKRLILLGIICCLSSCQPSSLEDFQFEGSCQSRLLLEDLRGIENREDLARMEPVLKKRFDKLVDLMIQARNFQKKHPELEMSLQIENMIINELLLEELKRVYALEGGRESLERAQKEAMVRLDAKERKLEKSRGS